MMRRVLCCALTALALLAPASPARAATVTPAAPEAVSRGATTSYTVYARKPGAVDWTEVRTYPTAPEAAAAAKVLYQKGLEVQVLSRFTLTHVPPRPSTGKLPAGQTVSTKQVAEVFRWAASQRDIAYKFPIDGCYARAHLIAQRMVARGLKPYKVWSFANGDEPLTVRTTNHPRGYVEWKYHVAPALRVRLADGKQRWYVIDPALFDRPVPINTWKNAQKRPNARYEPYVTVTKLGVAPKDPRGVRLPGSGYWPGRDPRDVDDHAVAVMRLYKPYEGRVPPAAVMQETKRLVLGIEQLEMALPYDERRQLAMAA